MSTERKKSSRKPAVPTGAVTPEELANFKARLSEMLIEEGRTIVEALLIASEVQENATFKAAIRQVMTDITEAVPPTEAFARHPGIFDAAYIALWDVPVTPAPASEEAASAFTDALARQSPRLSAEDLLTFDQAVQFLGTSKPTLYRLLGQDRITGLKVGRQWRFRKSDLVAYMEEKPAAVPAAAIAEIDAELAHFAQRLGPLEREALETPGDEEAKIVKLINVIFPIALNAGASDLHFDPQREGVVVRMRIDGVIHPIRTMPLALLKPLVARIKVMGDMDVNERHLPQDGRIHIKWDERDFDLRVSSLPGSYGESIVMRIMFKSEVLAKFDQISLSSENTFCLKEWLRRPNGLIMITGPTGSGKTTTLYAYLGAIEHPETKKLVSVEDPIEYNLPNVTQAQVNVKRGLTFPAVIRAMLRQDPDVILVGEIRDTETLQGALQAALTGHLVLSSMHTLGAVNTVQRLLDLGAEPFLVSSSLLGILNQRLVRRICPSCKVEAVLAPSLRNRAAELAAAGGYAIPPDANFQRGAGCAKCRNTGYKGRVPIYELLRIDGAIEEAIARRAPEAELTALAIEQGMTTVTAAGIRKAVEGITTVEEVLRVALPF